MKEVAELIDQQSNRWDQNGQRKYIGQRLSDVCPASQKSPKSSGVWLGINNSALVNPNSTRRASSEWTTSSNMATRREPASNASVYFLGHDFGRFRVARRGEEALVKGGVRQNVIGYNN